MKTMTKMIDDNEPPLLLEEEEETHVNNQMENEKEQVTIMDEMVHLASQAKQQKRQQQQQERNNRKAFATGFKKGFFTSTKPKSTLETKLRIVNKPADNQQEDANKKPQDDRFVFPQVQEAIKNSSQLNPNEWMNPSFFEKLAREPRLVQALQNPRFMEAINALQRNPEAAMRQYQHDAAVTQMLKDFMQFLGGHFEELGKAQDNTKDKSNTKPKTTTDEKPALQKIVDLDETRREAIAKMPRAPDEEAQVQRILNEPELLTTLSDTAFMAQLKNAQQSPQAFHQLMQDSSAGPKLRRLMAAGLVKLQ